MKTSLVCFDLGRVLVRICDSWAHAHACAGLPGAAPETTSPAVAATIAARVHAFETGAIDAAAFAAACASILDRPADYVARILDTWIRGATPGAVALLDALAARGHRLACLSNTNARHWHLMSRWEAEPDRLWPRLGLRFASHELGLRKPDLAIYAAVEAAAGVPGDEIVFFDDLADNVAAAQARGWRGVLVRSREDPVTEMRAWLAAAGLL